MSIWHKQICCFTVSSSTWSLVHAADAKEPMSSGEHESAFAQVKSPWCKSDTQGFTWHLWARDDLCYSAGRWVIGWKWHWPKGEALVAGIAFVLQRIKPRHYWGPLGKSTERGSWYFLRDKSLENISGNLKSLLQLRTSHFTHTEMF